MSRRRLRVYYSDDDEYDGDGRPPPPPIQIQDLEDEEDEIEVDLQEQTLNFESVTLNPNPNPIEIDASDDDEEIIDVSDNVSPPPQPSSVMDHSFPSSPVPGTNGSGYFEASVCPIGEFLVGLGLRLRSDWVDSCVRGLEGSVSGFGALDVAAKAKLCFEQFLFSDMNGSGAGILPDNVHGLHLVDLAGPFVLQVDEIVNMSCPLKGRYQTANPGIKRCLKLSMTDGVQRVFGMEYRPIKDLEVLAPAGLKIVIRNVHVRRGILLLVPEVVDVLGGLVEDLEAARQRLVREVNKPPRGKRTRNGVVPSLATRANHAAWPSNGLSGPGPSSVTTSQSVAPAHVAEPGSTHGFSTGGRSTQEYAIPQTTANLEPNLTPPVGNRRATVESIVEPNLSSTAENSGNNLESNVASMSGNRRTSVESNLSSTAENCRANSESNLSWTAGNNTASVETNLLSTVDNCMASVEQNRSSTTVPDVEEILMADEMDHPFILSGDRKFPFTYIASLSAKLAVTKDTLAYVQGTIKLVQKRVGHSATEVTAALSSSDTKTVSEMKEILKQFQIFLANFEVVFYFLSFVLILVYFTNSRMLDKLYKFITSFTGHNVCEDK